MGRERKAVIARKSTGRDPRYSVGIPHSEFKCWLNLHPSVEPVWLAWRHESNGRVLESLPTRTEFISSLLQIPGRFSHTKPKEGGGGINSTCMNIVATRKRLFQLKLGSAEDLSSWKDRPLHPPALRLLAQRHSRAS